MIIEQSDVVTNNIIQQGFYGCEVSHIPVFNPEAFKEDDEEIERDRRIVMGSQEVNDNRWGSL